MRFAIKKGQHREKADGFREMGILRCDGCGEEFFIGHHPASVDKELAEKQTKWLERSAGASKKPDEHPRSGAVGVITEPVRCMNNSY
jgi:hypothetical protein